MRYTLKRHQKVRNKLGDKGLPEKCKERDGEREKQRALIWNLMSKVYIEAQSHFIFITTVIHNGVKPVVKCTFCIILPQSLRHVGRSEQKHSHDGALTHSFRPLQQKVM